MEDCEGLVAIAALKTIIPSLTHFEYHPVKSSVFPKGCCFNENSNTVFWNYGMYVGRKYGKVGCGEGKITDTDCRPESRQICRIKGKYQHYKSHVLNHRDRHFE